MTGSGRGALAWMPSTTVGAFDSRLIANPSGFSGCWISWRHGWADDAYAADAEPSDQRGVEAIRVMLTWLCRCSRRRVDTERWANASGEFSTVTAPQQCGAHIMTPRRTAWTRMRLPGMRSLLVVMTSWR